ncbi:MAG: tRNA (guanine(10)-N(2))-dimethyltransferase [Candidatus Aenigmarchaeota archaeon]|nr:tRNA (guanine(10)-N(2))-dimethyltransferase [Candidatus Aenigmarchaeota archaeon]NIQ17268.1 tRNA (guanine(10)-N(2))-dimethyltransferase [Candidatus Aenigmarchaeota archaeon]NIS73129.1 tRNA (guanine(10)-N(2))-dimethyltransferase [Candidatus Aenigmarchaeota archaeon]
MKKIREGLAEVFVPPESLTKRSETFYNPEMEHQRNVTVASLRMFKVEEVLDPLAATGVRGIRILKEVRGVRRVLFNDINPKAVKLIEKNLKLNKIPKKRYEIQKRDANSLFLKKRKFDFVDIDPFGSPIRYLKNVGYVLRKNSLLGVTATDSGALAGKFAKACFRRYGVFAGKTDFPKELGVRVLITSILQNLAVHELTFEPLYSHANHYFRTIGLVKHNPDKNLSKIKMISYCPKCHNKKIGIETKCNNCSEKTNVLGPIWTGKIQDKDFCRKLLTNFEFGNRKEIMLCSEEIDSPFYYDLHRIAKSMKKSSPKIENVIENLKRKGFRASRTHLCATGVKTNSERIFFC